MTIDEAKRVRIVDFLAQLGHRAQYMKSEQYWYLSPLRKEVTPSFKVNDWLNEWYDFGEATGGDLVELGKYLCGTKSVSEALAYIKRYVNGVSLPRPRALPATSRPVEADMKNLIIVPLRHHALLSYLHSRMIDSDIGRMFCKEVHYELRQTLLCTGLWQYIRWIRGTKPLLQRMYQEQGHFLDTPIAW